MRSISATVQVLLSDRCQRLSNCEIESNEPAFLRRLRGEYGDRDSSRHERPLARPRKQVQDGEEDDQPTFVVEESQDTLSKAEYEALAADNADNENNVHTSAKTNHSVEQAQARQEEVTRGPTVVEQHIAGIGGSTKRRLAKVIGDEEEDEVAPKKGDSRKNSKNARAKKGKKMKLSFDEENTEP